MSQGVEGIAIPSAFSMCLSAFRKNVMYIVVGAQCGFARSPGLDAPEDFVAREIEDRIENLGALFLAGFRQNKEYASAVLNISR